MGVKCRHRAADTRRADTQAVDLAQYTLLHLCIGGDGMPFAIGLQQRLFRGKRRGLKIPADADADHHRRTGIRASLFHRLHDGPYHAVDAVRRLKHIYAAHILAAHTLWRYRDIKSVPRHDTPVNHRRRVVAAVPAVDERIGDDGFAQITVAVGLAHTLVYRLFKTAALHVEILPELNE